MRLLIVGSLNSKITTAGKIALSNGALVSYVENIDNALNHICNGKGADLLMVDVSLDIRQLIHNLRRERVFVDIVCCGINNDRKQIIDAIKAGAKEYVPLPPDEEMIAAVIEAIARDKVDFIGESESIKNVIKMCDKVANSNASILITGQSGTGKEVLAKYIHSKSGRKSKRMVSVNCAAIPENLLESELFGHEKGAFTGALNRRIGKFEEASGSTLLLDEISEMDLRLQAKLLRAIQEREIDRIGANEPIKVDIRILATSNRNLKEEIKLGNFREDLYFRLNVINIELPSLKERHGDIALFADYFNKKYCEENKFQLKSIAADALQKLNNYSWQGNVREIENIMHRAVLISSDKVIEASDIILNEEGNNALNSDNIIGKTISDVEKNHIIKTLDNCLGNRTKAAGILGISIRTLRNKLNEYEESLT